MLEVELMALEQLPLSSTVEEAARLMRINRTGAYNAVADGSPPSVHIGRSIRIPRDRLAEACRLADADSTDDRDEPAQDRPAVTPRRAGDNGASFLNLVPHPRHEPDSTARRGHTGRQRRRRRA
ncbi:MAG: helix-turn-helix domain-containing protein [Egibacteraceae bacterium]